MLVPIRIWAPTWRTETKKKHICYLVLLHKVSLLLEKLIAKFHEKSHKTATFNRLVTECIDRHAPLKRSKVTRPPTPWLNDPSIKVGEWVI